MANPVAWNRINPGVALNEGVQAALTLASLATIWMTIPVLVGLWGLEVVVATALCASFFPQRGLRRALLDTLKILAVCVVTGVILGLLAGAWNAKFDPMSMLSASALLILRIVPLARSAMRSPEPKITWTNAAMKHAGSVYAGLLVGTFLCLIPGLFIFVALQGILPDAVAAVPVDARIGLVLILVQVAFAIYLSMMTEAELRAAVANPYAD